MGLMSKTGVLRVIIAIYKKTSQYDSVITAVGMANQVGIMIVAIVLAVAVMLLAADAVSGFVERHPRSRRWR